MSAPLWIAAEPLSFPDFIHSQSRLHDQESKAVLTHRTPKMANALWNYIGPGVRGNSRRRAKARLFHALLSPLFLNEDVM